MFQIFDTATSTDSYQSECGELQIPKGKNFHVEKDDRSEVFCREGVEVANEVLNNSYVSSFLLTDGC